MEYGYFPGGELNLKQSFQMVSGTIIKDGRSVVISRGKVRGNEITFSADGTVYTCQADKNSMKGTAHREGKITEWKAERKK